jgi:DNA-binding MarR family transcriptional regulator
VETITDRLVFLLAQHGMSTASRIRQAFGATGLTFKTGMALMYLSGGPASQQSLIERLAVDPSVVVAILNDLERDGLAQRRRHPADRRRHIVALTEAGTGTLATVEKVLTELEQELFTDLTEAETAQLRTILGKLHSGFDETCTED